MNDDSETSDEDTVDKIAERLKRVKKCLERERTRSMCYAAAMSRRWDVPADHFHERAHGPKKWKLKGRGYVYKTAEENGGVKSMVEMCLDVIDAAYETMGELVRPEKRWLEAGLAVPTAYEHNECLCAVTKRQRVK